jgi:hypothetical protein
VRAAEEPASRAQPPDLPDADDGAGEGGEGEVDVGAALVADGEASEPGEPGQGALDFPAEAWAVGHAVLACLGKLSPMTVPGAWPGA